MADYKGYMFEKGDRDEAIVSPYGDKIAIMPKTLAGESVSSLVRGVRPKNHYEHRREILKDIADQHLALIGGDEDEGVITSDESKVIINGTVRNLQINSNSLGIQITDAEVEEITAAVDRAPSGTLKKILKEWIPQAVLGSGLGLLLKMLGIG